MHKLTFKKKCLPSSLLFNSGVKINNFKLIHNTHSMCFILNKEIKNFHINSICRATEVKNINNEKKSFPQLLVDKSPQSIQPYLRLTRIDKPIGTWLLLYPCLWSLALADTQALIPSPYYMFLFAAGAIIMRGAGCTVNDLWDRDFDKKVERTKSRPIASGEISVRNGILFLGAQLLAGLAVLVQFNWYTIAVGASSLALVFTYPLMKRITYWPQSFLGLTFNWGAFVGYSAFAGYCSWPVVIPLYLGGIAWTIVYDTIYAHQDKKDDKQIGVKSTALLFGDRTKEILTGFTILFGSMMSLSGYFADYHVLEEWPYYASVLASVLFSFYKIHTVDYNNTNQCMKAFVQNKWVGLVILLGIIGANYLKRKKEVAPLQ